MYKMDSHIHSEYSPDSKSKLKDIFKVAKNKNIDIIGISDHNTVEGSKEARKLTKNDDLLVIPSIEVSALEGHILGFGCEEKIKRDLEAAETIDLIHDQGGLAIIPHPYCFYRHGLLCKADYKELKIDCEKDIDSVLKSIKKAKVEALGKGTSNIRLSKYLFDFKILKKYG